MAIDIEEFYRCYGPMVLRRCRRLLRDEQMALDAMQDVFVQLIRFQDKLVDSAPSSLLFRMATNVCLNKIRTHKRKPEHKDEDLLQRIAAAGDNDKHAEARSLLGKIFAREQESTAAIAVMHLLDGMTLEQVAAEVGMSVSGVRKRLRTLKARVAELDGVSNG